MVKESINTPPAGPDLEADAATAALQLAARLHAAAGNAVALREALKACGEWLGCSGALALAVAGGGRLGADELVILAGRAAHCAGYGTCNCGGTLGDKLGRARCAALVPHLYEVAKAMRNASQAALFDQMPPVWILGRRGRVRDANAAAQAIAAAGEPVAIADGKLAPAVSGGGARLYRELASLDRETRFNWPDRNGHERTLLLHPQPGGDIAATLLAEPLSTEKLAAVLVERLNLTRRQGDLAAYLLADHTLASAARAMGISRQSANEHLAGLLRQCEVRDRKALLSVLRRAAVG